MSMMATAPQPSLVGIPRLRAWLFGAFVLSLYLPWGISYYSGGSHFEYWFDSGIGGVAIAAALTIGIAALPVVVLLAPFGLALWRPRSRALVWICRVLLVVGLGVLVWAASITEPGEVSRRLSGWELLWGGSGRYAALLVVAAAVVVEIRNLIRRRADVAPDPPGVHADAAVRSEPLHRATVVSALAIPLGLVLLAVVATVVEIAGAPWDVHYYLTAGTVVVALLALYGRAIALATRVDRDAPAGRLAAAVVVHALAQVAAGVSVLIIGAPLAGTGAPLVPAGVGLGALGVLWTALLIAALLRAPRLAGADWTRFLLCWLALAVVAHPLLTGGVVRTVLHGQLLVAGAGWATMQLLALIHWARSWRAVRRTDVLLTALPAATCLLAVVVGMTVLHAAIAFSHVRM